MLVLNLSATLEAIYNRVRLKNKDFLITLLLMAMDILIRRSARCSVGNLARVLVGT